MKGILGMYLVVQLKFSYWSGFSYMNLKLIIFSLYSGIVSAMVSFFSSMYISKWKEFFPLIELKYPPSFDGRAVCYPSSEILRDYLSWRQVDCEYPYSWSSFLPALVLAHVNLWNIFSILLFWISYFMIFCVGIIVGLNDSAFIFLNSGHINNQYNTCFWTLVKSGKSKSEAQKTLKVHYLFFFRTYTVVVLS